MHPGNGNNVVTRSKKNKMNDNNSDFVGDIKVNNIPELSKNMCKTERLNCREESDADDLVPMNHKEVLLVAKLDSIHCFIVLFQYY